MPLFLKVPVHRELTEKRDGHDEVGPVAMLRLGEDRGAHPTACPNFPSKTAGPSAPPRGRVLDVTHSRGGFHAARGAELRGHRKRPSRPSAGS
jgi:hypothetical protein